MEDMDAIHSYANHLQLSIGILDDSYFLLKLMLQDIVT